MSAEPTLDADADVDSEREVVDAELVRDLVTQLNSVQDRLDDVETELDEMNRRNEALRKQTRALKTVLAGSTDEFSLWDIDKMRPLKQRIVQLEEQVSEQTEKMEMFVVEDGKSATPDERAMHLRQVLWNKAQRVYKESGGDDEMTVTLSRSECTSALGADLARQSIIDAMKRAADGGEAGDPNAVAYSPIMGSSELQPMGAFEYRPGQSIGSGSGPSQSEVVMETSMLSGVEARKISYSDGGGGGR